MGFGAGFLLASLERHIHKTTIWVGGRIFRFKTFEKALGNFIFLKKNKNKNYFSFLVVNKFFSKIQSIARKGREERQGFDVLVDEKLT